MLKRISIAFGMMFLSSLFAHAAGEVKPMFFTIGVKGETLYFPVNRDASLDEQYKTLKIKVDEALSACQALPQATSLNQFLQSNTLNGASAQQTLDEEGRTPVVLKNCASLKKFGASAKKHAAVPPGLCATIDELVSCLNKSGETGPAVSAEKGTKKIAGTHDQKDPMAAPVWRTSHASGATAK